MTGAVSEATGTPQPLGEGIADVAAEPATAQSSAVGATRFAHASEAEMARILDFYEVRWDYEPTTFPILWNLEGDVVESFAPDFYLPEYDLHIELTTMRQSRSTMRPFQRVPLRGSDLRESVIGPCLVERSAPWSSTTA